MEVTIKTNTVFLKACWSKQITWRLRQWDFKAPISRKLLLQHVKKHVEPHESSHLSPPSSSDDVSRHFRYGRASWCCSGCSPACWRVHKLSTKFQVRSVQERIRWMISTDLCLIEHCGVEAFKTGKVYKCWFKNQYPKNDNDSKAMEYQGGF